MKLTTLECDVLKWLLAGDDPVLVVLSEQLTLSSIVSREITGCGFYLHFAVPNEVTELHKQLNVKPNFSFGDVEVIVSQTHQRLGFLLWIRDGKLAFLEGYTYGDQWPTDVQNVELLYLNDNGRDWDYLHDQWSI